MEEVISRKVLVDEGTRQVVEVEQAAIWRFLWWSRTISVHVLDGRNEAVTFYFSKEIGYFESALEEEVLRMLSNKFSAAEKSGSVLLPKI
ncbi:hypothetical protein OROMI_013288 [Orobanche minor]